MSKASDTLIEVLGGCVVHDRWKRAPVGKVVENLPEHTRNTLKELKSDDISRLEQLLYPFCHDLGNYYMPPASGEYQKQLELAFDKKLKIKTCRAKDDQNKCLIGS